MLFGEELWVVVFCCWCGVVCLFFPPSPCSSAGVFLNYMQKTAVQLVISTFTVEHALQCVAHALSVAQEEH